MIQLRWNCPEQGSVVFFQFRRKKKAALIDVFCTGIRTRVSWVKATYVNRLHNTEGDNDQPKTGLYMAAICVYSFV